MYTTFFIIKEGRFFVLVYGCYFFVLKYLDLFFFFFQAEDGIRDATVTGVQTCALPISRWPGSRVGGRGTGARRAPAWRSAWRCSRSTAATGSGRWRTGWWSTTCSASRPSTGWRRSPSRRTSRSRRRWSAPASCARACCARCSSATARGGTRSSTRCCATGSAAGELEVRAVDAAVVQLDDELAAGVRPGAVGLPDVDVGVGARVVEQHAEQGGQGRLDGVGRRAGVTGDRLGLRVARSHDAEPLVAVQAEVHRHRETRPHGVAHRQVVDRLQEPGEIEQRAQRDPYDLRVVVACLGGELRVHVDGVVVERLREQGVAQQDVVKRLRVPFEVVGVALSLRQGLDQVVQDPGLERGQRRRELEVVEVADHHHGGVR